MYGHPAIFVGDWIQDPLQIPQSTHAQVPYSESFISLDFEPTDLEG